MAKISSQGRFIGRILNAASEKIGHKTDPRKNLSMFKPLIEQQNIEPPDGDFKTEDDL